MLQPVKECSDYVIDTSGVSPAQLKTRITELFLSSASDSLSVHCISFGFKYGIPWNLTWFSMYAACLTPSMWRSSVPRRPGCAGAGLCIGKGRDEGVCLPLYRHGGLSSAPVREGGEEPAGDSGGLHRRAPPFRGAGTVYVRLFVPERNQEPVLPIGIFKSFKLPYHRGTLYGWGAGDGNPGFRKSTLAAYLQKELRLPMMSKDKIKELLFDTVGLPQQGGKEWLWGWAVWR